jgi:hypothetical protein
MSAVILAGEFVRAHETMGKNRPAAALFASRGIQFLRNAPVSRSDYTDAMEAGPGEPIT